MEQFGLFKPSTKSCVLESALKECKPQLHEDTTNRQTVESQSAWRQESMREIAVTFSSTLLLAICIFSAHHHHHQHSLCWQPRLWLPTEMTTDFCHKSTERKRCVMSFLFDASCLCFTLSELRTQKAESNSPRLLERRATNCVMRVWCVCTYTNCEAKICKLAVTGISLCVTCFASLRPS